MKSKFRVPDYLQHVLDAIERIRRYTSALSEADFWLNDLVQDAVLRNIEIIGEAVRNIEICDPQFASDHPEIPFREIYSMRNRLAHGYFAVNPGLVWEAVQRDIPTLETQITALRKMFAHPDAN